MDSPTYADLAMQKTSASGDEPPASRAFRSLTNHIDELDACINDLVGRINPVLAPDMAPQPDPGSEPAVPRSVLTDMIIQQDLHVQGLIHLVNDTFRRVEI